MKTRLQACRHAMLTALINAALALTLMLLAEFAIIGTLRVTEPYLWAGLLIWLVIFSGQYYRQLRLRRCNTDQQGQASPLQPAAESSSERAN